MEVVVQLVLLGTAIGVGDRDVVERVPFEEDEAGPQVDLLQDAVPHEPVGRTADGAEVGSDQVVGVDQRRSVRGEPEVVQVLCVAVARADGGEAAVGGVVDDPLAAAEAARLLALPPGEDGLALVALHLEVVGLEIARHRVEPDQPAGRVQDHRPTLALGPLRRDEDVPGSCAGSRDVDVQRARLQVGTRVEACDAHPLRAGLLRGQRRGDRRGDREAVDDRAVGPNRHPFAVGERLGGQDARAPAVGVRPELPGVRSAPRSGDLDVVELAPRDAADRDLRPRRGGLRAVRREHADPARQGMPHRFAAAPCEQEDGEDEEAVRSCAGHRAGDYAALVGSAGCAGLRSGCSRSAWRWPAAEARPRMAAAWRARPPARRR